MIISRSEPQKDCKEDQNIGKPAKLGKSSAENAQKLWNYRCRNEGGELSVEHEKFKYVSQGFELKTCLGKPARFICQCKLILRLLHHHQKRHNSSERASSNKNTFLIELQYKQLLVEGIKGILKGKFMEGWLYKLST